MNSSPNETGSEMETTQKFIDEISNSGNNDLNTTLTLHTLRLLMSMSRRLDEALKGNAEIKTTLSNHDSRLAKLETAESQFTTDIKDLKETQKSVQLDHKDLSSQIEQLKYENQLLAQSKLDNDLFISGFPSQPDSDKLLEGMARHFQFEKKESSYHYSFTWKNPKDDKLSHFAVIGFLKKQTKSDVFKAKAKSGPLFLSQIIESTHPTEDYEITLSNRFTPENLQLYRELRELKKDGLLHRVIYKNCKIYAQKQEKGELALIREDKDIKALNLDQRPPLDVSRGKLIKKSTARQNTSNFIQKFKYMENSTSRPTSQNRPRASSSFVQPAVQNPQSIVTPVSFNTPGVHPQQSPMQSDQFTSFHQF